MENKLFNELPKKIIDKMFDEIDSYNIPQNEVYHYTSLECFYNILNSGTFWFSNIQEVNDPIEIEYGINTIFKYFIKDQNLKDRLESIYDHQKHLEKVNQGNIESKIFIFSTSQVSDNYQQWINYADNGNGVCIGLDRGGIFESMRTKMKGKKFIYTYPVQYYKDNINISENQITNFEKVINNCFQDLYEHDISEKKEYELYKLLVILSSLIKDKFHKGEEEIRYFVLFPFKNMGLPQELLERNQIDIVYKKNCLSMITKLVFHDKNIINMDEKIQIANRSIDYKIIKKIILGPRNTNNILLLNNIIHLLKKYNCEFNNKNVIYSEGKLK